MMKYEKPAMSFVELRNKETVADTCWGLDEKHPHAKAERYYDVPGAGYVSFHVKGSGSCANPDAYTILYYAYEGATPTDGTEYEAGLENALKTKGGSDGQPYKGLSFDFPTAPKPEWS